MDSMRLVEWLASQVGAIIGALLVYLVISQLNKRRKARQYTPRNASPAVQDMIRAEVNRSKVKANTEKQVPDPLDIWEDE